MSFPHVSSNSPTSNSNLERSSGSDGFIRSSIDALTASITASFSEESDQAAEKVTIQLRKLMAEEFDKRHRERETSYNANITTLLDTLGEVTRKNKDLLNNVDVVTSDLVTEIIETIIGDAVLQSTEKKLARYELENAKLRAEIEGNQKELDELDRRNTGLEKDNSILVGHVKNELLKLAVVSQAQELLNQLKPSNLIDLERVVSELNGVAATLTSLRQFGTPNATFGHLVKVFNHLTQQIGAWKKQQMEASKPIDQPRLERLLDSLRRHLIPYQLRQIRDLIKECKVAQIQSILPDLKKELKEIWNQVKSLSPSEQPELQSAAPKEKKDSSWWLGL